jgi:hypothetical protein
MSQLKGALFVSSVFGCLGHGHHHHARGTMKLFKDAGPPAKHTSVLPAGCYSAEWPHVKSCAKWWTNGTHRYVEGNSIPDHDEHGTDKKPVGPYCPFGIGGGYCLPEEGGKCPFDGMVCPDQTLAKQNNLSGDVPVPFQIWYEFPLHPDPTAADLPNHLYHNSAMYQQVGVHLNGVHIKGPSEAEGYNVDQASIPLLCGGHVTPPIGPGPVYHYHKSSNCGLMADTSGTHSPLIGYAIDGFAMYGRQDLDGTAPVVDECNGHFGPIVAGGEVSYHYHTHDGWARDSLSFEKQEPSFQPYWIGCQGPSKSLCNTTIKKAEKGSEDLMHVWCGVGCGYDLCVQPGTTEAGLKAYLNQFVAGSDWLKNYTVNDYTNYPRNMYKKTWLI